MVIFKCPNCGSANDYDNNTCWKCGYQFKEEDKENNNKQITCPKCHKTNLAKDTLCWHCGHDLNTPFVEQKSDLSKKTDAADINNASKANEHCDTVVNQNNNSINEHNNVKVENTKKETTQKKVYAPKKYVESADVDELVKEYPYYDPMHGRYKLVEVNKNEHKSAAEANENANLYKTKLYKKITEVPSSVATVAACLIIIPNIINSICYFVLGQLITAVIVFIVSIIGAVIDYAIVKGVVSTITEPMLDQAVVLAALKNEIVKLKEEIKNIKVKKE